MLFLLLQAARAQDFPPDFFFGVALAPAQAEDELNDAWLRFAKEGHVHAWDVPYAADRLRFWTEPEVEIALAAETNSTVLRMGVDWGRLYPDGVNLDEAAMRRYEEIVQMARGRGLKVMMTLFHHSAPIWMSRLGNASQPTKGWTDEAILPYFARYSDAVAARLGQDIDYWTTFNEPHVFAAFTYCAGMWPAGPEPPFYQQVACTMPGGAFDRAMANMAAAHNAFVKRCRAAGTCPGKIGAANNVGYEVPDSWLDWPAVRAIQSQTKFKFQDLIQDNCDFVGINYYGREIIHGAGPVLKDDQEYSESGRCVDPNGLYESLKLFWHRYQEKSPSILITENGISDATDILRPAYTIEHLVAIQEAIKEGVKVDGYVHWTTSDNWEWVDGYCPKFGMAAVDRENGFKRVKRPSFDVYATIAGSKRVTQEQRDAAWGLVAKAQAANETRPFCRAADGKSSLDTPVQRPFAKLDWRFHDPHGPRNRPTQPTQVIV